MIKIIVVFGTRPEAIKMSPIVLTLRNDPNFDLRVAVTGQHKEMLNQVLDLFNIIPDYNLNIMKKNQTLTDISSSILVGMDKVFSSFDPDLILVHGDTATTFSAALSAYYHKISVAHVEAGLRTGNILSPWPEEGNRKLTSTITELHFAPTEQSKENLIKENIDPEKIVVTGNTVIDALMTVTNKLQEDNTLKQKLDEYFSFLDPNKRLILVTSHRRENFGQGFENIFSALADIASQFNDIQIIYPLHLNPNVREPAERILKNKSNVFLVEPLDYLPFIYLMNRSYVILTDSGGIQEEAPSLGKPVLVMRDTTERPEAVAAGTVKLVGTNKEKIIAECKILLQQEAAYDSMSHAHNPYGDGQASNRIKQTLLDFFNNEK